MVELRNIFVGNIIVCTSGNNIEGDVLLLLMLKNYFKCHQLIDQQDTNYGAKFSTKKIQLPNF